MFALSDQIRFRLHCHFPEAVYQIQEEIHPGHWGDIYSFQIFQRQPLFLHHVANLEIESWEGTPLFHEAMIEELVTLVVQQAQQYQDLHAPLANYGVN